MPEWLRRILSVRFNPACSAHDSAYGAGLMTQEEADRKFLKDMKELAGWNPFWYLMAYLYYFAARSPFGRSRYASSEDEGA
jgi:hypothetical protein